MYSEKRAKKDLSQLLATLSTQFGVQPFFTWTIGVNDKVSSQSRVQIQSPSLGGLKSTLAYG
jgi:hypothetical protein